MPPRRSSPSLGAWEYPGHQVQASNPITATTSTDSVRPGYPDLDEATVAFQVQGPLVRAESIVLDIFPFTSSERPARDLNPESTHDRRLIR